MRILQIAKTTPEKPLVGEIVLLMDHLSVTDGDTLQKTEYDLVLTLQVGLLNLQKVNYNTTLLPSDKCTWNVLWYQAHSYTHSHQSHKKV